MARIVTGSSDKGGVCKTTTAHNLGACLAELRKATLLVDVTQQGNLTFACGVRPPEKTLWHHFRRGAPLSEIMVQPYPDSLPYLWLIPSDADLIDVARDNRDYLALAKALDAVKNEFDFIILDPPGDTWNWNAMACYAASDEVIIMTPPGAFEVTGASNVAQVLSEVQKTINPRLRLCKLLITKWDKSGLANQLLDFLHRAFSEPGDDELGEALKVLYQHDELGLTRTNPLFKTKIRYSKEFPNDQARGLPAILSGNKIGAEDYRELCKEFLLHCQLRPIRTS